MAKKSHILLSVIFPLLNASEDIQELFHSVANQSGVNKKRIEILVIDDGSKDQTLEQVEKHKGILKNFADFRILKHSKRLGLARTRYDSVSAAKGRYITFIDKKCRPDKDYLENLLNKSYNIVIGNYYTDRSAGGWNRVLSLIRQKIYYPYFNYEFKDIELDYEAYKKFKNKGGGSVMLVLRKYYLEVAKHQNMNMNVNDDTWFVEELTKKEPLLKTATARAQYMNRTGFLENIKHLFGRGPKFVDYYSSPSSRFFPFIVIFLVVILISICFLIINPFLFLYELAIIFTVDILISLYLSHDIIDFFTSLTLLPIAVTAFSAGVLKGLTMKAFRLY